MPLTNDEIGKVSDIIMMPFAATVILVSGLNSTEISLTQADITEFDKVKNKFNELEGGKMGLKTQKAGKRLGIRNRVRVRLGLIPLENEYEIFGVCHSIEYSHPGDE